MQSLCISMDCTGVLTKSQIPPIPGSGAQGRRRPVPDDGRPPCQGLEQRRLAARAGGAGRVGAAAGAARGVPHRAVVLLRPGAEVDKVELDISAQYTRIYPYSCRGCIFLMYSVNAPMIIMCLSNSPRAGYNVIRLQILCLSLADSRTRLCATTAFWGRPRDAAGKQDANAGYQLGDNGRTVATKREMCLAHPSRMPGPRREIVWVSAS